MYPVARILKESIRAARMPALPLTGTHVSHHVCWPFDIDTFLEMNNGRTLTLYDIGRTGLAVRIGLIGTLRDQRWGLTVAGSSVRYRARVRPFQKVEMLSRCIGWDERFVYVEQSMWRGETCTSNALLRTAVTDRNGLVRTPRIIEAMGVAGASPELPEWVQNWITAEDTRPWPPLR